MKVELERKIASPPEQERVCSPRDQRRTRRGDADREDGETCVQVLQRGDFGFYRDENEEHMEEESCIPKWVLPCHVKEEET